MAKSVNYDRILKAREAEPQNWLTYYGAYDGQRFSPLDQINADNVGKLKPAWVFQCGSTGMHSGASTYSFEAVPARRRRRHVRDRLGWLGMGAGR